jgi:hypothetical protein
LIARRIIAGFHAVPWQPISHEHESFQVDDGEGASQAFQVSDGDGGFADLEVSETPVLFEPLET